MKISAALKDAFKAYSDHFGDTVKFLAVEGCITLAALAPLLFLSDNGLKYLAFLAAPLWMLLVFWARVNAAGAMQDALNGGRLFSCRLADPSAYGKKLVYGIKRLLMLVFWAAPMIASLIIAVYYKNGDTDAFTLLKMIKDFGGGNITTGVLYLALIFVGTVILVAVGCAFHSGDRHAFVRGNRKLLKGHHGKLMLCWLCSVLALLPLLIAIGAVVIRYLPVLQDITSYVMTKNMPLPSTKVTAVILAVGAVLTIPLLPLRSLIPAAFVNGLEKE